DPHTVFLAILDDLKVKNLRLPVYWDKIEPKQGSFDFSSIDQQLNEAKKRGVKIVLVVGRKLPRWPECFEPGWTNALDQKQYEISILDMVGKSVDHFKGRDEIVAWQVENEPMFNFGICQKVDKKLLTQEIDLVRSKDKRPIILTDSGELGFWTYQLKMSDIMGTTLYRRVWGPIFGLTDYPLPPLFYRLKAALLTKLVAPHSKGVIISELQAEPWPPGTPLTRVDIDEQVNMFDINEFKKTVAFAARTGFKEDFLWGAEWWYFMKEKGHPEYWNFAKTLFQN
ncbi:beta-galactosidase, partial [Candidatus Daviesbacteria bacterium]|nr:beta-galactosidase [Candidatus Daviesbacteria bacterium]